MDKSGYRQEESVFKRIQCQGKKDKINLDSDECLCEQRFERASVVAWTLHVTLKCFEEDLRTIGNSHKVGNLAILDKQTQEMIEESAN